MENSTKQNERLKKYTAVAGAFLASGAVNAQISYTDVNPDQVVDLNNSPFLLDMDGDMVDDLQFTVSTFAGSYTTYGFTVNYSGTYAGATAATGGGIAGSATYMAASAFSGGENIDGNLTMNSFGNLGLAGSYSIVGLPYSGTFTNGNFIGQADKYLGVSFQSGGNTHYGWVRLDVSAGADSITIKDYAYNTVASDSIAAGQMVGLENVVVDDKVTFKTMLDEAYVNVTPDLIGGQIVLIDMSGRELSSTPIEEVNTKVVYGDVNAGIYMLVARFESGQVSKKIYVR